MADGGGQGAKHGRAGRARHQDVRAAAVAARGAEACTFAGYPQPCGVAEADGQNPALAAAAAARQQDAVAVLAGTPDDFAAQAGAGGAWKRAERRDAARALYHRDGKYSLGLIPAPLDKSPRGGLIDRVIAEDRGA